jgi:hypothetical protein
MAATCHADETQSSRRDRSVSVGAAQPLDGGSAVWPQRILVMNNSIQTLGIVHPLFPKVLSGKKTSTIRWREAHIVPGPMRYVCDGDDPRSVIVTVFKCTDMPLAAVAAYLGKTEEWPDKLMLAGMREHYPEIELSDIVQVVEHTLAEPDKANADPR